MANVSKTGFTLVKHPGGSGMAQPMLLPVISGYQAICGAVNVDLCVGDPVSIHADGYCYAHLTTSTYTAANAYYGVVVGIDQYWSVANNRLEKGLGNRVPGATVYGAVIDRETRILVQPFASGQVWEVEFDVVAGQPLTYATRAAYKALVGANVELLFTRASAALARANLCLSDALVSGAVATHPFRILDIPDETSAGPQDWTMTYVKAWVTANYCQQTPVGNTTGV